MNPAGNGRIDTAEVRRRYPLAEVMARYGVVLRPGAAGRFSGRCPFHQDRRPSLAVYADDPADEHFHCFAAGCGAHGDVIRFVELIARLPFRAAVAALTGGSMPTTNAPIAGRSPRQPPHEAVTPAGVHEPAGRACLAVAVDLYHQQLLADRAALAYCAGRGLDANSLLRHRVGYAPPRRAALGLVAALRERRLPLDAAVRAGLLDRSGRERLAGRVVFPEIRERGPLWLIGRSLDERAAPRYLGLPGRKPLLGWAEARGHAAVCVTEGVVDRLALSGWGLPALALAGTHARREALGALARFRRVFLILDADDAGRAATAALQQELGTRAVPVPLPGGAKDVADLALQPDGRAAFLRALAAANPDTALLPAA